jgi:hypothetical protein
MSEMESDAAKVDRQVAISNVLEQVQTDLLLYRSVDTAGDAEAEEWWSHRVWSRLEALEVRDLALAVVMLLTPVDEELTTLDEFLEGLR